MKCDKMLCILTMINGFEMHEYGTAENGHPIFRIDNYSIGLNEVIRRKGPMLWKKKD
jgi:hypothetical protein